MVAGLVGLLGCGGWVVAVICVPSGTQQKSDFWEPTEFCGLTFISKT